MKITQRVEDYKVRKKRDKYAYLKYRRVGMSFVSAYFGVTTIGRLKPIKIYHKNKPKKHGKANNRQRTYASN